MTYFTRASSLFGFTDLVRARGRNPSALLREAGLSTAALHDPDLPLSYTVLTALYARAAVVCDDEHFGLHLGGQQDLKLLGPLATYLCLQPTLCDALSVLQKNLGFHARGMHLSRVQAGETLALTLRLDFEDQMDCQQMMAKSLATLVLCIQQMHEAVVPPLLAGLAGPAPRDPRPYEAFFGCPVQFEAEANVVCYPASLLMQPVKVAPDLRERLVNAWRGDWQHVTAPSSLASQVERIICALLPTGDYALQTVARLMQMPPRTLQQRLHLEQMSYGRILQQARQRLACQHLEHSDIALEQLAHDLGYAELSVFSRAFKQWLGVSPRVWRRQQLA